MFVFDHLTQYVTNITVDRDHIRFSELRIKYTGEKEKKCQNKNWFN